ncbi:hypothetical protein N0V90_013378 [Kalmusia sp. IMI 367209]|nr:hypothetical protein N0V90_013378 [Kalmusia sp. IMI 367209]
MEDLRSQEAVPIHLGFVVDAALTEYFTDIFSFSNLSRDCFPNSIGNHCTSWVLRSRNEEVAKSMKHFGVKYVAYGQRLPMHIREEELRIVTEKAVEGFLVVLTWIGKHFDDPDTLSELLLAFKVDSELGPQSPLGKCLKGRNIVKDFRSMLALFDEMRPRIVNSKVQVLSMHRDTLQRMIQARLPFLKRVDEMEMFYHVLYLRFRKNHVGAWDDLAFGFV